MFIFLPLSLSSDVTPQEASRYFPLAQENTWIYLHKHVVNEGGAIKPAALENIEVTTDTLTMKVNGTITAFGKTYAILELDNKVWGYYRVEGNYLYKKYNNFEGKLVDFTPSEKDDYYMADVVFLPSYREVVTLSLPYGIMTGYGCYIEHDIDSHTEKYMFFVDSIGLAQFSISDGWKTPPESDNYSLISYDVPPKPSSAQEFQVQKTP